MATKRARRPWSKEDVRELRAHSRSKSPVKKIARAMKRTAGALRQKAHDLGLPLGHRRCLGLSPRSKVRSRKAVALLNMAVEPLAMAILQATYSFAWTSASPELA